MYLIHNVFRNIYLTGKARKNITFMDILKSGKLLPSIKTKNMGKYGLDGSPYIYLRIDQENDVANLYLDYKLLLNGIFYLRHGWNHELPEELEDEDDEDDEYNYYSIEDEDGNKIQYQKKFDGTKLSSDELLEILQKFKREIKYKCLKHLKKMNIQMKK